MKRPSWLLPKSTRFAAVLFVATVASAASANWRFDGGEGSYYAYVTDGGFVDGTYQNGLMFFCPDDGNPCLFYVTINGQLPQPPVVVSFSFSNGQTVQRLAEPDGGSDKAVIGWEGDVLANLLSQDTVAVSIGSGPSHTFSLSGSSSAIERAMNP